MKIKSTLLQIDKVLNLENTAQVKGNKNQKNLNMKQTK
jgi:hypothetical protein